MKKFAYILLAGAAVLASCNRDERNFFDMSAQERVQHAQEELYTTLTSYTHGWEVHYFPSPERAGYAFLMSFDTDMSVKIAAKNSVSTGGRYKEEVSMWDTDGTQGAVLSFKTFNSIFHKFADPGSDGLGLEGDYEFVIMNTTDECIRLKGKKHGAYVYMYPLSSAYTSWEDYFAAIDDFGRKTTYYNEDAEMNFNAHETSSIITLQDGYFTRDTSGTGDLVTYGYILLPGMLRFYSGMPFSGGEARDFVVNEELTAFLYTQDNTITITPNYSAADFVYKKLHSSNDRWMIQLSECDGATRNAWSLLNTKLQNKGAKVSSIGFEHYTSADGEEVDALYFGYYVDGRLLEGNILLTLKHQGEVLNYSVAGYSENIVPLLQRLGEADLNAATKKLAAPFIGAFTVKCYNSSLNLTKARFDAGIKKLVVMTDGDLK